MTPEQLAALLPDAVVGDAGGRAVADVPVADWVAAVTAVRDAGADYLDLLTAVDEQDAGLDVVVHLWDVAGRTGVLLRTRCPADDARVPSLAGAFAGATWHERQVTELFGIAFDGSPDTGPLLLPAGSPAPLRKSFVLVARTVVAWPGAPEPGQSSAQAAVGRRRTLPPGVPAPGTWGP